jgi:hypothetical protein
MFAANPLGLLVGATGSNVLAPILVEYAVQ